MPLKITDPQKQVAVLNRWADWIETKLRGHETQISVATAASSAAITSASSGTSFDEITSGTSVNQNLVVGGGTKLMPSGNGLINATEINGIPITGKLTHAGQIPISQPGNASAVWADPLVQGLIAVGQPASGENPVLVGGSNPSGNITTLAVDASGNLSLSLQNTQMIDMMGQIVSRLDTIILILNSAYGTDVSTETVQSTLPVN
jgi:hypothetical protein